jgi:metallo-beta-lactamase family protein
LESTYGGRFHPDPASRKRSLHTAILHALDNDGSILVPAFSLGRVQELLVELDFLKQKEPRIADLEIILDSPIALKLTEIHRTLQSEWSQQAKRNWQAGRRPLSPESFTPIETHSDHLRTVKYLKKTGRPALVLASSGMCEGGRIVNYLKHLLPDPRHDLLFLGYQARGTLGEAIQRAGRLKSASKRVVNIQGQQTPIKAAIRTLSGYSAHADHAGLLNFTRKLKSAPKSIRLVHGDRSSKLKLKKDLQKLWKDSKIIIPG